MTLAARLLSFAPREHGRAPLSKVFYADNGSAGVEVALKMAFHWFLNRGIEGRTKFIALDNGYHGETLGALAVGDIPLYRRVYAPLLAEAMFAPSPDAYLCEEGETPAQRAHRAADALAELLERHAGEVCALILEPRVQCAGGMRMHDPAYLKRARELCDAHGVFLICDEIAVGFGGDEWHEMLVPADLDRDRAQHFPAEGVGDRQWQAAIGVAVLEVIHPLPLGACRPHLRRMLGQRVHLHHHRPLLGGCRCWLLLRQRNAPPLVKSSASAWRRKRNP